MRGLSARSADVGSALEQLEHLLHQILREKNVSRYQQPSRNCPLTHREALTAPPAGFGPRGVPLFQSEPTSADRAETRCVVTFRRFGADVLWNTPCAAGVPGCARVFRLAGDGVAGDWVGSVPKNWLQSMQ